MINRKNKKLQTIHGTIVPVKRDRDGKITAVAIQTGNNGEFLVEQSRTGQELYPLESEEIWAQGTSRERLDGKIIFRVQRYKRLVSENNKKGS